MKTCFIINPASGSAGAAREFLAELAEGGDAACLETSGPGDATRLAAQWASMGAERIVAVGGDGTIQEAANGILEAGSSAVLGILPLGTGNDLARTLGIPESPEEALRVLEAGSPRWIDLIEVHFGEEADRPDVFALNAVAGGFSAEVTRALEAETKEAWGPFSYLLGAARALTEVQAYRTTIEVDGGEPEEHGLHLLVVANGRTAGGGKEMAPLAEISDGRLDLILVHAGNLAEQAEIAANLLAGSFLDDPRVEHRPIREIRIDASPAMAYSLDGELMKGNPAVFKVCPTALKVLVP